MKTVNSETGCERQRLARQHGDAVHRFSALSVTAEGLGRATEPRGATVLIKEVFEYKRISRSTY